MTQINSEEIFQSPRIVLADYVTILRPGTPISSDPNATPIKYLNDVDELDDGITLILSEPSKKFSDRDCLYSLVEHGGDGRYLLAFYGSLVNLKTTFFWAYDHLHLICFF